MDDDEPGDTADDSLLRAVASAPPIPVPRDLATFVLLEPGTVIDDAFRIEARLGAGGMGVVYAARDLKLDREVALKLMRLDRGPAQLGAKLPDVFEREARATARLNHPNIVTLHQFGNWNGLLYLVLERLRGETLNARMERGGVSLAEGLAIVEQVARALVHTHAAGITHRDLKPQNVFLLADGGVKVLDFGVSGLGRMHEAAPVDVRPTRARSTLSLAGTPGYMAPEQWDGLPSGPQTDMFAAGVMLYQLVTGALPFGTAPIEVSATPPSLDGKVPAEAVDLVALVASCLEPRPKLRFADANELLARLQAIRAALGDVAGPSVTTPRGALATARVRGGRKNRIVFAVAATAIAMGGAFALRGRKHAANPCEVGTRLASVWNAKTREALAAKFEHTAISDEIARTVDTYAGQWQPLREAACRAEAKPAQTCLDDRFMQLARFLDKAPSLEMGAALTTARSLPPVADCSDPDYLARLANPEQPRARDPHALVPYALSIPGRGKDIVHAATFFDGDLVIAAFASSESTLAGMPVVAPAGHEDRFAFVARIGSDGKPRWLQTMALSALVMATSGDNVVIGGAAAADAVFAGKPLAVATKDNDGMLLALDGNTGELRWFRPFAATSAATAVRGLDVDRDGNLYAAGGFGGTATFGGEQPISAGDGAESSPFVASFTPDGKLRWVQAARGAGNTTSKTWGVGVDGDAVVAGSWMRGTAKLGAFTIGDQGSCVVARLARDTGDVKWVHQERGGNSRCVIDALAIRGDRIAVGGRHYFAQASGFVMELALADGSMRWVKQIGDQEHDKPKALAFARDGTLFVGGQYNSSTLTLGNTLVSNGARDAFVTTFDPAGTPIRSFGLGGVGLDIVRWIRFGPHDEIIVGGRYDGSARIADRTLRGVAGTEGFVAELSPSLFKPALPQPASSASP